MQIISATVSFSLKRPDRKKLSNLDLSLKAIASFLKGTSNFRIIF